MEVLICKSFDTKSSDSSNFVSIQFLVFRVNAQILEHISHMKNWENMKHHKMKKWKKKEWTKKKYEKLRNCWKWKIWIKLFSEKGFHFNERAPLFDNSEG